MKRYLGGGVHVQVEDGSFMLTCGDGIQTTQTICLEPKVFDELTRFVCETNRAKNLMEPTS